ncbi:hypothetical protein ACB098_04G111800 [Castanea mollissima]
MVNFGWSQLNALFRKKLTLHKRNVMANIWFIIFPILACSLLGFLQNGIDINGMTSNNSKYNCGCTCVDNNGDGQCDRASEIDYSALNEGTSSCPFPRPPEWPPLLRIPNIKYRAVKTDDSNSDLPDESCKDTKSCPASILLTGNNQSLGETLGGNMFPSSSAVNFSDVLDTVLGTETMPGNPNYLDPAFFTRRPIYNVQPQCFLDSTPRVHIQVSFFEGQKAYDLLNSNESNFNVSIGYNSSNGNNSGGRFELGWVPRLVNLVTNAYLKYLRGPGTKILFEFVKEMSKPETPRWMSEFAFVLAPPLLTWVILQLFFVMVTSLVYEKEQKLRITMKMHGLRLKFFTLNDYNIQFVFYFIHINLQISVAFPVAAMFTNVQTVTAVAYICLFGTGFLGYSLFQILVETTSFPKFWIVVMELYPGFSLYCFLLEFAQIQNTSGIEWRDLNDSTKGMSQVLIIMLVEWFAVFIISYYIDQIKSRICGKSPWSFSQNYWKKPSFQSEESNVQIQMEEPEVRHEREKVEQLLLQQDKSNAVICYNLKKVYPAKNGNPEKLAVRNLSLALPLGECFGMIGLNDSGKTTFINMVTGLTTPTPGKAFIHGLDIRTQMDQMYTSMGICLQHDLLWETLTGREHLLFYGRFTKLRGRPLTQAVEECLKTANPSYGKVSDKQVGKYSKGMKRRLSVAIALIGDPKMKFMECSKACKARPINHSHQSFHRRGRELA